MRCLSMVTTLAITLYIMCADGQSFTLSGSITEDSDRDQKLTLQIDPTNNIAQITMSGESSRWFGTGFGSHEMDHTYSIVADGQDANVGEWRLNSDNRGSKLSNSLNIISNTVSGSTRTVVLTRNVTGNGPYYYNFPTKPGDIEIIWAYGPSSQPYFNKSTEMGGKGDTNLDIKST